ncbi:MAG TPA: chloride channel protein [Bryobacteraceae bacterium]|nr:chloride channel protein [Bryobacteraceae bacterium]
MPNGRTHKGLSLPAMSETQRFLLLAILIGIFAGLMVVCFHVAIDFLSWYSVGALSQRLRYARLICPTAGALVSVLLVRWFFRAARGSGVNQTKAALYISDGHVPFSTVIGKFLTCSISIGTGNSLGPEDPSLQMGAGIASLLGRMFQVKRENMRLIAPVGAAAGIAAAFNTPITGVLFVMEEVVAAWNAGVVGSIMLAAVSAVVVVRWFLGNEPLFRVPEFELRHPSELVVYAILGVAGGLLSALFVKLIEKLKRRLEHLPSHTAYAQAGAAGLLVGVAGLWLPQIMGAGYDAIDSALHDRFAWQALLALGLVKLAATVVSFSAEIPGGMFAPTLFTGAMIGGGLGALANRYWPFPTSFADAYVLVGMGTFFAGVFRAPMTSIFMVFEVSASYVIILPVMIANTISYFISRTLHPVPFFTMLAQQEGVDLPSAEEQRSLPVLHVEEAMRAVVDVVLPANLPVAEAAKQIETAGEERALVTFADGTWSTVTAEALRASLAEENGTHALKEACRLEVLPRLYPDQSVDVALRYLGAYPLLPVVNRAHPDQLEGVLSLEDIHRAYGIRRN